MSVTDSVSGKRDGARVRAAAARVVDAVAVHGRSLDTALQHEEVPVAPADLPLLRMLGFGVVRHYWSLRSQLEQLLRQPLRGRDRVIESLLLVGLLQIRELRIPDHAAVSLTVEAARVLKKPKLAGLVNGVLRRYLRDEMATALPDGDEARRDHPAWLIDAVRSDWPHDWERILTANNERAPMWLRVNSQQAATREYVALLHAAGIEASLMDGWPQAIRLAEPCAARDLPGFDTGQVSVQDAAAQLAAPWLLDSLQGNRLLDACAAPGGKSAHLKELGGDGLSLIALDKDPDRARSIEETFGRLGLHAKIMAGDASTPAAWHAGEPYDGILLDAPCSATGVIRRHPDIKLLRRASDIEALAGLQGRLLAALWPLLRPGGRLLYVTCSVLGVENDKVVGAFLAANGDAMENNMLHNYNIRDVMRRKAFGYQVLPGTAGMDGFYFACLEKVA